MKFRIEKIDDTDAAREMHKLAFGGCKWPGDDHEFWIARDQHGAVVGFASAILLTADTVYLSRAAVAQSARGWGLHRTLIKTRLAWAKGEGCNVAVTYVENHNYESLVNLLRCKFRFAPNRWKRGWQDYHLMYIAPKMMPEAIIRLAFDKMEE